MTTTSTTSTPPVAPGSPAGFDPRARPLTRTENVAALIIGVLVMVLGFIGLANSFAAVAEAARPILGRLAWTLPLGIDIGLAVFAATDLLLARLDMRPRWLRLVPWSLIGLTVYLNVAHQTTVFGWVVHACLPLLWVVAVEVGIHAVRVRSGLASGRRMDSVPLPRFLLDPARTVAMARRMILWNTTSYPEALLAERDRILARTELQDAYGGITWRWRAPRRLRALYRLGALAPRNLAHHVTGDTKQSAITGNASAPSDVPATGDVPGGSDPVPEGTPLRDTAKAVATHVPGASDGVALTDESAVRRVLELDAAYGRAVGQRLIRQELSCGTDRARRIRALADNSARSAPDRANDSVDSSHAGNGHRKPNSVFFLTNPNA